MKKSEIRAMIKEIILKEAGRQMQRKTKVVLDANKKAEAKQIISKLDKLAQKVNMKLTQRMPASVYKSDKDFANLAYWTFPGERGSGSYVLLYWDNRENWKEFKILDEYGGEDGLEYPLKDWYKLSTWELFAKKHKESM